MIGLVGEKSIPVKLNVIYEGGLKIYFFLENNKLIDLKKKFESDLMVPIECQQIKIIGEQNKMTSISSIDDEKTINEIGINRLNCEIALFNVDEMDEEKNNEENNKLIEILEENFRTISVDNDQNEILEKFCIYFLSDLLIKDFFLFQRY